MNYRLRNKISQQAVILSFISIILTSCDNTDSFSALDTTSTYKVKPVVFNEGATSVTDNYPYYSLLYKGCFPYGEAETFKEEVEFSFGVLDGVAKIISPADRILFNLSVYPDALFSTFKITGISKSQFDTLETDYLFYNLSAGGYYIDLSPNMNCLFFQSVNGNYGLVRVNSIIGSGLNNSAAIINFEVKYVAKQ